MHYVAIPDLRKEFLLLGPDLLHISYKHLTCNAAHQLSPKWDKVTPRSVFSRPTATLTHSQCLMSKCPLYTLYFEHFPPPAIIHSSFRHSCHHRPFAPVWRQFPSPRLHLTGCTSSQISPLLQKRLKCPPGPRAFGRICVCHVRISLLWREWGGVKWEKRPGEGGTRCVRACVGWRRFWKASGIFFSIKDLIHFPPSHLPWEPLTNFKDVGENSTVIHSCEFHPLKCCFSSSDIKKKLTNIIFLLQHPIKVLMWRVGFWWSPITVNNKKELIWSLLLSPVL